MQGIVQIRENRLRCYKFLFTGLIVVFLACQPSDMAIDSALPYSFFVAGHVSGNPANWHQGFHAPFREKLHLISKDTSLSFGFLLGDMVKNGSASNFEAVDRDIALLEKPVHIVAGNHDVSDRQLFDQHYGPSYYMFRQNGDLFIVLDSNLDGWNIQGDQLEFFRSTLKDNPDARNIFIFVHHLLWWSKENKFSKIRINSSTGRAEMINFYSDLVPLLHEQKAPSYFFAGDVGAQATGSEFMYFQDEKITYIASGMGGGVRDNFIIINVDQMG